MYPTCYFACMAELFKYLTFIEWFFNDRHFLTYLKTGYYITVSVQDKVTRLW